MEILVEVKPSEYFCTACCQLRLNYTGRKRTFCGNCSSHEIIESSIGTLDKDALLKQYKK